MATAAKKTAAKKTPVTTALVKWDEEMAAAAQRGASAEKLSGFATISTRGGILAVDGTPIPGNALRAVIIAFTHENQYYTADFDSDNPAGPACYSFGDPKADNPEHGMAPHENSSDPQGDDNGLCANCWANAMGTDPKRGKGKACKNVRRAMLITEDALESPEALEAAEARLLKIPTMSTRGWAAYVHKIAEEVKRPPWGVVTTVSIVPDAKAQFKIVFEFAELIGFDQAMFDTMKNKIAMATKAIVAPYPDASAAPPPPPPRGRPAPAAKQAAKQAPARPQVPARKTIPIVPTRGAAGPAAKRAAKY